MDCEGHRLTCRHDSSLLCCTFPKRDFLLISLDLFPTLFLTSSRPSSDPTPQTVTANDEYIVEIFRDAGLVTKSHVDKPELPWMPTMALSTA